MLTKEQLQERAQLVRIHEANCQLEYPTAEEANFRLAVMKQLGREYRLKEVRALSITGPVVAPPGTTKPGARCSAGPVARPVRPQAEPYTAPARRPNGPRQP